MEPSSGPKPRAGRPSVALSRMRAAVTDGASRRTSASSANRFSVHAGQGDRCQPPRGRPSVKTLDRRNTGRRSTGCFVGQVTTVAPAAPGGQLGVHEMDPCTASRRSCTSPRASMYPPARARAPSRTVPRADCSSSARHSPFPAAGTRAPAPIRRGDAERPCGVSRGDLRQQRRRHRIRRVRRATAGAIQRSSAPRSPRARRRRSPQVLRVESE